MEDNIIQFKPRQIKIETVPVATVAVKGKLISLEIDRELLLTPQGALELCVVLVSAIKAINEQKDK